MADALVSQFTEILATMAKEEVTMLLGAEDALRQLEKEVLAFSGVLQDAERSAFTNQAVRRWLADVKDLVYDADDIIDYSRTHAEKLARLSSENPVFCYSMLLFFRRVAMRHWSGKSIKRVNERLEGIRKRESDLNLIAVVAAAAPRDDHDHRGSISRIQRQTGPIILEPNIVGSGIEKDTSDLVALLTKEELGIQRIPIVAITGMGGVGKTTLAQKIHNHKTIKDSFREPPPVWVCVSQQYSDEKLLKEIIRKCAIAGEGGPERDHESFAELQERLANAIKGKKFFLILDDVWAAKVWVDLLQIPLQSGAAAAGSRVLITTRQQSVARQMGAIHLHTVHQLTDEQSWSLLCKLVGFQEGGSIGDGGEVGEIGRQIAEKCGGLPLAIKTIAGVLMKKSRTRREWEKVLTNPAWSLEELPDGVMGVLYLSYQDLPFQLKQCFIFFSVFPEDFVLPREFLTRLWVAEGFIAEKGGEDVLLEDVADDYYNELLSRSLLQPIDPEDEDEDEGCKMHDLLRSLAQFLAGDEYFVGDSKQLVNATNTSSSSSSSLVKLRHIFLNDDPMDHSELTRVVKKHESLRTLFLDGGIEHTDDTMDFLFSKLRCLRVLGYSDVESLPKSVGNLIHLRGLSLSGSSSLVELPETVGNLSNLQYLILYGCRNLKKLPRGIAKLYKLRVLHLEDCDELNGLTAGIGRLRHLNYLKGFVPNEEEENEDGGWCSLEELRSLSQLRTLTITNLERALMRFRGQPRAGGFILKHLRHLRHLKLWCSYDYQQHRGDDDEKQKIIQLIFEVDLFPPPSLETFQISGYFGLKLPIWDLPNLTRLKLTECNYLKQLPTLGRLPNLNDLSIWWARSVESIGPEFMGMGKTVGDLAFRMLRRLELGEMSNLEEWQWEAEDGVVAAMPRLEVLNLYRCQKLSCLPGGLGSVTTLTTLSIQEADSLSVIENIDSVKVLKVMRCQNLRCLPGGLGSVTTLTTLSIQHADSLSVIENIHSLKVLEVIGCRNLTRVSNLPALQDTEVICCHALREVEGLCSLQSLLITTRDEEKESLPGWLLLKGGQPAFPMLKSLTIELINVRVLHRCLVDGPDWPKIQHYPQVHITKGELFVRYTKDPFTFATNLKADGSAGDGGATTNPKN